MRFYEFLVEYNRNIMLKRTSPKILDVVKNDNSVALPKSLLDVQEILVHVNKTSDKIPDDKIANLIEIVVAEIEEKDPTSNKQYVPWLVRMYSRGGVKYEDLNRHNLIGMYEIGKKRKLIKPEHRDINRFKTYQEFEDVMFNNYDLDEIFGTEEDETEKPQAKKVFDNEEVLVIVPENKAAACKYGKNTRWCTAAVHSHNYFDDYNKEGPLYILIPKIPQHNGEKYQLQFETNSYMDEHDEPVSLGYLLRKRFPGLYDFFINIQPEFQYSLELILASEVDQLFEMVKQYIIDYVSTKLETYQYKDEKYLKFLEREGFVDDDGEIDWERVEDSGLTYKEFIGPIYDRAIKFLQKLDSNSLWDSSTYDRMKDIRMLPFFMVMDMCRPGVSYDVYGFLSIFEPELSSKRLIKTPNGKWKIIN